MTSVPILTFHDGGRIPQLGVGTYNNTQEGVQNALKCGYKHLDCAFFYENQAKVGKAIKNSGVPRDQLFITSKVWTSHMSKDKAKQSLDQTLKDLETDYVDLLLVHWPYADGVDRNDGEKLKQIRLQVWNAFIEFKKQGKAKHIGVSNFLPKHIDQLLEATHEKPVLNQIINHPYLVLEDVIQYCGKQGILIESWSPLGQGKHNLLMDKTLNEIAQKHNKTPAQVIIRWNFQNNHIVIPKSQEMARLKENLVVMDFELTGEEMVRIDKIHHTVEVDKDNIQNMFVA